MRARAARVFEEEREIQGEREIRRKVESADEQGARDHAETRGRRGDKGRRKNASHASLMTRRKRFFPWARGRDESSGHVI